MSNAIATMLTLALALLVPVWTLQRVAPEGFTSEGVRMLVSAVMVVILVKHLEPVRDFFREKRRETHRHMGSAKTEKES